MLFSLRRLLAIRRTSIRKARRTRLLTMLLLLSVLILLLVPIWVLYKPPRLLFQYFGYRWPDVLWDVSTSKKVVALTIDDGPSEFTKEILDILKSNDATATFFVIGSQVAGREEVLHDLLKAGNELGNHGTSDQISSPFSIMLAHEIDLPDFNFSVLYGLLSSGTHN